jgi:hypothetical protein
MPLKLNRTLYTVNADLNTKAPTESPALEGIPTAPTATSGTNTTQIATTQFVGSAITAAAGNLLRITTFTSSGTWTKQSGVSKILVHVIGGGGNGGYVNDQGRGAGGGGGGYSQKLITSIPESSILVTVAGATGTSSFGSYCSATGGASPINQTALGVGGQGIGGDLNFYGQVGSGGNASTSPTGPTSGGLGGNCGLGINGVTVGNAIPNTGAGGRGGFTTSSNDGPGSAGASGLVIIYEYGA